MEDEAELRIVLRGLLTSRSTVITSSRLFRDFKEEEERDFPYRKLGFNTFVDYLKSIPNVCKLFPSNSYDPEVHPIASVKSKHIDELVSKQKAPPRRASRGRGNRGRGSMRARYAGYTPRPPPILRRPQALLPTPQALLPTPPAPPRRLSPLPPAASAPKGVYVNQLEDAILQDYNKENLSKYGVPRGSDLLQHTKDMVRISNEKLYPNTFYKFDNQEYFNSIYPSNDKHSENDYNSQGASNCHPAPVGVEEEDEDEYYDEYEDELNDESFWNNDEEYISKFTIERCTKLKESEENNNKRTLENKEEDKGYSLDDHESQFSKKMISNFRFILDKNPDGVWTSELVQKYKEYFFLELDLQNLGYSSAINMAVHLPNVFSYERVKTHDWKLYDARKYNKPSSAQEKPEARQEGIPTVILDNIRSLVQDSGSIGIKSSYLFDKYQLKYKKSIDTRALGFSNLEQFLIELEQQGIFTLRKMDGFYHIQKKHELIPLQVQKPPQVSAPAVINPEEAVSIHIPDFVCRLGTKIEPQTLPKINVEADPSEPLIEMAVKVGEVISPNEFFLILDSCWNDLECLMEDLKNLYVQEEKEFRIPLPYVSKGLYCAVQYQGADGDWHRAQTVEFAADDNMKIEYIDYGTPATVNRSKLRFLHTSFASVPAQAIRAKLSNIRPSKGAKRWSQEAKNEFLNLIIERRLIAQVYKISTENTKERMQLDVILYDTTKSETKPLVINEYLVEKGFAEFDNHDEGCADKPTVFPDHNISSPHPPSPASASTHNLKNENPPKITRPPPPGFGPQGQNASTLGTNQSPEAVYMSLLASLSLLSTSGASLPPSGYEAIQHFTNHLLLNTAQNQQFNQNAPAAFNAFNIQSYNSQQHVNNWLQNTGLPQPHIPNQPAPQTCNQYIYQYHPNYYNTSNVPLINPIGPQLQNPLVHGSNLSSSYTQYPLPNSLVSQFHQPPTSALPQQVVNHNTFPTTLPRLSPQLMGAQAYPLVQGGLTPSPPPAYDEVVRLQNNLLHYNSIKPSSDCNGEVKYNTDENRPKTPLTPVSTEITNVFNRSRHDSDMSQLSHTSEKLEESIQIQCFSEHNLKQSPKSANSSVESEQYYSSEENIGDRKSTDPLLRDGITSTLLTNCINEIDTIPDSWDDFELDDTPSKAENFMFDCKKPLDVFDCKTPLDVNEKESDVSVTLKEESGVISNRINKGSNVALPGTIEMPVTGNWKDIFNPDIKSTFVRPDELIIPDISSSNAGIKKGVLVQKIDEFQGKPFHLITVNNKPAVIANEFYVLFTCHQWPVIEKLAVTKSMEFPVIIKTNHKKLFEELKKVQFPENTAKALFKRDKVHISYLSEVSNMLVMLKSQEKKILELLKKIMRIFEEY